MRSTYTVSISAGRLALAAASIAVLVSACGVSLARPLAAVPGSPQPSPAASPSPSPTSSESGLGACRDGDCEARVRQGDSIAVDARFGVTEIGVVGIRGNEARLSFMGTSTAVDGRNVSINRTCFNDGCHVKGAVTIGTSTPGRIGGVAIRLARVEGDQIVLVLKPVSQDG